MKTSNLKTWTIGAGLALASFAGSASALGEQPEYVRVRHISYAGSGCPNGSVAENLSQDGKAFTLLFDSYVAEIGPGIPLAEGRKNCAINVDLDFPAGWSFSILDVDYRGYAHVERGATAEQKTSYYFQGDLKTASLLTQMRGPVTKDYQIRDTLGLDAVVWSPCGATRSLNMNTQVRNTAQNRLARALITIDSIDGQLTHIYGLQWRRCH